MKSAIFIVSIALCMSSCISRKYCDRKFPDTRFDSSNKSIEIITKYRDTTIYINIKGDTFRNDLITHLDTAGLSMSRVSELQTSLAISKAWVTKGILHHELVQNDTLLSQTIKNAITNSAITSTSERIVNKAIITNILSGWQWFQIWLGRILLFFSIIYFGFKIFRLTG